MEDFNIINFDINIITFFALQSTCIIFLAQNDNFDDIVTFFNLRFLSQITPITALC